MLFKISKWVLPLIFTEAGALFAIRHYNDSKKKIALFISMLLYATIPIYLYKIVKENGKISVTNLLWNVLSSIYGFMIGVMLFSEKVSKYQILGALIGLFSICLLNKED